MLPLESPQENKWRNFLKLIPVGTAVYVPGVKNENTPLVERIPTF